MALCRAPRSPAATVPTTVRVAMRVMLPVVLLGAALAGCSGEDNEAGMGLPNHRPGESYPGARGPVTGTVRQQSNGCFRMDTPAGSRLVVWPGDSDHDPEDPTYIRLPSGRRVHDGDRVAGTGLEYPATALPGVPDGYWGGVITFCAPDDATVLVLDDVRPV